MNNSRPKHYLLRMSLGTMIAQSILAAFLLFWNVYWRMDETATNDCGLARGFPSIFERKEGFTASHHFYLDYCLANIILCMALMVFFGIAIEFIRKKSAEMESSQ